MTRLRAETDAGQGAHHCTMIDADSTNVLSRRMPNNEPEPLKLISDVLARGHEVTWAIDLNVGGGALLIAHDQQVVYISGPTVHHASDAYCGEGKIDAKDAFVIADQACMHCDLPPGGWG